MAIPKFLYELLTTVGPSGYEQGPAGVFRKRCEKFAKVSYDSMGSTVARVEGTGKGLHVALVGHIDEIGVIVHHIDDDGFLWFTSVGGSFPTVLLGHRVRVLTRNGEILGLIQQQPVTPMNHNEVFKKPPRAKDLHIDIGAKDGDEAREMVRIGDVAVIDADPVELPNNRVMSRALDNRLGCYVAYRTAKLVADAGGAPGAVSACAVTQEEIGGNGSLGTAYSLRPDIAIGLDVRWATDSPGSDEKEMGSHPLGSGPIIQRGVTMHPTVHELLVETAEREKIPYTIDVSSEQTFTDADSFVTSRGGVPSGLVSFPLRYTHSAVEVCQLDDIENSAKLLAAFLQRLPKDASFLR